MNAAYDEVFDVLLQEYRRAVSEIGKASGDEKRRRFVDPGERLAEHLIAFYWRGRLTWENEGGMLSHFFERAPDRVRADALEYVGRNLWQGKSQLTAEEEERLRELCELRISAFEQDKVSHQQEVSAFGWWFASSGKLSDEWLLSQLLRVLEAGASIDADHLALERLVEMAPEWPTEAVHAARLMIRVQTAPYFVTASQEAVRRLVSTVLMANEDSARAEARDLLNDLAARGFVGFDDLAQDL